MYSPMPMHGRVQVYAGQPAQVSERRAVLARVNYREVAQRFTHIDARFVSYEIGLPERDGFFTVELYPWWEHPLYIEARETGANWGFTGLTKDAYRPVTVYPQRIRHIFLSSDEEVTDWDFTQEHPLLWQFEHSSEITCNSPMPVDQWMQITEAVCDKMTGYNRQADLADYATLARIYRYGKNGSFSLGRFPRPLFFAVRQELAARGFSYFAQNEPEPTELPVLFLIDDSDYIIAGDFEIDVPEFIHKPEWFQPHGTPTRTEE